MPDEVNATTRPARAARHAREVRVRDAGERRPATASASAASARARAHDALRHAGLERRRGPVPGRARECSAPGRCRSTRSAVRFTSTPPSRSGACTRGRSGRVAQHHADQEPQAAHQLDLRARACRRTRRAARESSLPSIAARSTSFSSSITLMHRRRPRGRRAGCPRRCRRGRPAGSSPITASVAMKPASGKPPPMPFPKVRMSGTTPRVLAREPAAGAADAGLHLVGDQQRARPRDTRRRRARDSRPAARRRRPRPGSARRSSPRARS